MLSYSGKVLFAILYAMYVSNVLSFGLMFPVRAVRPLVGLISHGVVVVVALRLC